MTAPAGPARLAPAPHSCRSSTHRAHPQLCPKQPAPAPPQKTPPQALRLIQQSAAAADDSHSQAAAAAALAAVAPAWVGAGRDASELWAVLVGALEEVPPHRRLALLAALLRALPKVGAAAARRRGCLLPPWAVLLLPVGAAFPCCLPEQGLFELVLC